METNRLLQIRQDCLKWAIEQKGLPSQVFVLAQEYYDWIINNTKPAETTKQINS